MADEITIPRDLAREILAELQAAGVAESTSPERANRLNRLWRELREAMGE